MTDPPANTQPTMPSSLDKNVMYDDTESLDVDYDKILWTDDEEAYLKEFTAGEGGDAASKLPPTDGHSNAKNTGEGGLLSNSSDGDNLNMNESVASTSSFTARFFPPSPVSAQRDATETNPNGSAPPSMPTGNSMTKPNPSTPNRAQATPPGTPSSHAPPTQYIINDPSNHYDDDISTIANDTVARYTGSESYNHASKNSNPNQLPGKSGNAPTLNHKGSRRMQAAANSPDGSRGAEQPTHIYTYNKLPRKKAQLKEPQEQEQQTSSSSSDASTTMAKMEKHTENTEIDNKSVYSMISYKRFRGGSGWSRKNYILASCMVLFLLAVIGGLGYTFHRLQSEESKKETSKLNQPIPVEPDANSGLNNPLPGGDNVFDGWTFRPTGATPTTAPSLHHSNAPSPIGPSPRPTRPPTSQPTKRPSGMPSVYPSSSPTTIAPTASPSTSPSMTPAQALREVLKDVASDITLQAIEIIGTPQKEAFDWLHQDPNFFTYLQRRQIQRFALAVLYFSTTLPDFASESLETWMKYDSNECTWFTSWFDNRLACGSDDIFKFLTLRNINLLGSIPAELALLTKLNSLVLSNNGLSGTIPLEFGTWPLLENLDLRGNYLTGPIPNFKDVPNLKSLELSWNQLTGNIPGSISELSNLQHVDLTENSLFGFIPEQLCYKGLQSLAVDCNLVACTCCTQCSSDETRAPVVIPPTQPTPPPTPSPVALPTPSPVAAPIIPPPTSPLIPGQCVDSITTTKACYLVGEPIVVSFTNCNALGNDWVGAYASDTQNGLHFSPLLWKWSCGSQGCYGSVNAGSLMLDVNARGGSGWPLAQGTYKAWLFRRGATGGPYPAYAETQAFVVRDSGCF